MTRLDPHRVQPVAVKVYRLYRFYRADGVLLYIGQTGREPLTRLIEHLYEQQWAHEIARWEVDPQVWHSEADVLAAELAAIRAEKPLRNWVGNEGNPDREWLPKVGEYRHPGRRPAPPPKLSPRWRRRRNWAIGLGSGWLAATLLLWWADAATTAADVPGRTYPIGAAGLVALAPLLRSCSRRKRRWVVAGVAVTCAAAWLLLGAA